MKTAILSILLLTTNAFAGNVEVTDLGTVSEQVGAVDETLEVNYFQLYVEKSSFVDAHSALQSKCNDLGTEPMMIKVIDTEPVQDSSLRAVTALCRMRF